MTTERVFAILGELLKETQEKIDRYIDLGAEETNYLDNKLIVLDMVRNRLEEELRCEAQLKPWNQTQV